MNAEGNGSLPRSGQLTPSSSGETIYPIELDIKNYQNLKFSEFVDRMYQDIRAFKNRRFRYYNNLRGVSKANAIRLWLTRLAVAAALLTGVAAVLRLLNNPALSQWDIWAFAAALLAYAAMGALSLYERSTDQATAYFRHLGVTLAIRDLWTKVEFAFLKVTLQVRPGDADSEKAGIDTISSLAEAFCKDLDKLASEELGEWRTEFIASLSELDNVAKQGTESAREQLQGALKAYEQAAAKAEEATKAAEALSKPALLNLTIEGEFDDAITIQIDNREIISTHLKTFPIDRLAPGSTKIEAQGQKDGKQVAAALWVDLKPGIQSLALKLM
jgi:hypothetical protein